MNGFCSSKDKKSYGVFYFSENWILNFAILKSSYNSEMDVLIKKFLN